MYYIVFFSLFGIYNILKNGSNKRLILAYLGVAFVGFGSCVISNEKCQEQQFNSICIGGAFI